MLGSSPPIAWTVARARTVSFAPRPAWAGRRSVRERDEKGYTVMPNRASSIKVSAAQGKALAARVQDLIRLARPVESYRASLRALSAHRPGEARSRAPWVAFARSASHTAGCLSEAAGAVSRLRADLVASGIDPTQVRASQVLAGRTDGGAAQSALSRLLSRNGFDAACEEQLRRHVAKPPPGLDTLDELLREVESDTAKFEAFVHERVVRASAGDEREIPGELHVNPDGSVEYTVPCVGPAIPICVVMIIFLIISLFGSLIEGIVDGLEGLDDDNIARGDIERLDCAGLSALDDAHWIAAVRAMVHGFCGNADEKAILKLFGCLSTLRVRTVVDAVGEGLMLKRFQGPELDTLVSRFRACGILDFAKWDDDATRAFIQASGCTTLTALTTAELRQIALNLFQGVTTNTDEQAILKLLDCQTCDTLHALVALKDVEAKRFLRQVQGKEHDRLEAIFHGCGIK